MAASPTGPVTGKTSVQEVPSQRQTSLKNFAVVPGACCAFSSPLAMPPVSQTYCPSNAMLAHDRAGGLPAAPFAIGFVQVKFFPSHTPIQVSLKSAPSVVMLVVV